MVETHVHRPTDAPTYRPQPTNVATLPRTAPLATTYSPSPAVIPASRNTAVALLSCERAT